MAPRGSQWPPLPERGIYVGTRSLATVEEYGRRFEVENCVIVLTANELVTYHMDAPTASGDIEYHLVRQGDITGIENTISLAPRASSGFYGRLRNEWFGARWSRGCDSCAIWWSQNSTPENRLLGGLRERSFANSPASLRPVGSHAILAYDFNWQLGYNTSIQAPKGTVLHVDAHFDNSVNNKFNPNPNKTVYYGTMTWEEMMNPFYSVVVPKDADPAKVVRRNGCWHFSR